MACLWSNPPSPNGLVETCIGDRLLSRDLINCTLNHPCIPSIHTCPALSSGVSPIMDARTSKKSRSIGMEPKASRPAPPSARPQLGDRTQSDPALARSRPSQTHAHGQGQGQRKDDITVADLRISDVIDRDSQASIRDDPFFRSYQSPHSARLAAESRIAHGAVKRNEDVGSPSEALVPGLRITSDGFRAC